MDKKELRIGNLLRIDFIFNQYEDCIEMLGADLSKYDDDDITPIHKNVFVEEIRDDGLVVSGERVIFEFAHFTPIEITSENLIKLGFSKEDVFFTKDTHFTILFHESGFWYVFENYRVERNIPAIEVKYIHNLQNMFYVFTGKELDCAGLV